MEKESKLSSKRFLFIAFLISAIAAGVLAFVAILPLNKAIVENKNKLEEQKQQLELVKSDMTDISKYQHLSDKVTQDKNIVDEFIVTESMLIGLIQELEAAARVAGVEIEISQFKEAAKKKAAAPKTAPASEGDDLSAEKPVAAAVPVPATPAAPAAKTQSFMVLVKGNYRDIVAYLYKLENFPYPSSVSNVEISRNEKAETDLNQQEKDKKTGNLIGRMVISFNVQ
jgi:hypothetical protein